MKKITNALFYRGCGGSAEMKNGDKKFSLSSRHDVSSPLVQL